MGAVSLSNFVEALTGISDPDLETFVEALGGEPSPTGENPKWAMYELDLDHPHLERADLRLAKTGSGALLSLWAANKNPPTEKDLQLDEWGQPISIDINPRIPPEGTVAFVYLVNDVRVSVQMTHTTRKLRSISLEWSGH